MYLIAGLGNPGLRYRNTRHNIGFQVVKTLARELNIRLTGRRFHSKHAHAVINGKDIILIQPMTFMNLSGLSVKECMNHYGIKPEKVLVIHDDLDLPLGRIKLAGRGGAGGHRGVKSISDCLESSLFPRVKIGIGRPVYEETIEDYVLSPFYRDQKQLVKEIIEISIQACRIFINNGIESAMNQINSKKPELKEEK